MVEPDRVVDDLGRKPMAVVGSGEGVMPSVSVTSVPATSPGYRDNALVLVALIIWLTDPLSEIWRPVSAKPVSQDLKWSHRIESSGVV
jgi:hypothetical protein